jgi:uncharacterized protein YgiM (DUF1202 family)
MAQSLKGTTMYVANKTAAVKSGTGLFAGTVVTLQMGDTVTIVTEKDAKWVEVRTSATKTGWVTLSSLTSKRITAAGRTASASELALAGKGFSSDVETHYRDADGLDYTGIDAMETQSIQIEVLQEFITTGHLQAGE